MTKTLNITIIIVLSVCFFSCKSNTTKQQQYSTTEILANVGTNITIHNPHFIGKTFRLNGPQFECSGALDSIKKSNNHFKFIELRQAIIDEPLFYCRDTFHYTIASCNPRDVIFFECKDSLANNEVQFFNYLDKRLFPQGKTIDEELMLIRKDSLDIVAEARWHEKNKFLDEYNQSRPVSLDFYKLCKNIFTIQRNQNLCFAYARSLRLRDSVKIEKLQRKLNNDSSLYKQDDLLFSGIYELGARRYCEFLTRQATKKLKISLLDNYQIACKNFTGKTKDFLLYEIYHGMLRTKDEDVTKVDFYKDCQNEEYKEEIRQQQDIYKLEQMSSSLEIIRLDKSVLSFKQLLAKHKGKIIYIDIWASWCEPCRKLNPAAQILREENPDVVFVYISCDEIYIDWKKACITEKMNEYPENYCLLNAKQIRKKMNISHIPYFMLYNKEGKLVIADAPRPDTKEIREFFVKYR